MIPDTCRMLSALHPPGSRRALVLLVLLVFLIGAGAGGCEGPGRSPEAVEPPAEEVFEGLPADSLIEEESIAVPPSVPPEFVPEAPADPEDLTERRRKIPLSSPGAAPMDTAPTQPVPDY